LKTIPEEYKPGIWRSRPNRARRHPGDDFDSLIGFHEIPYSEWYEVPFPFKAHAQASGRELDYESKHTVNASRRISQSFTNRLRSINWNYYLHCE
jgi:hypothetical protein